MRALTPSLRGLGVCALLGALSVGCGGKDRPDNLNGGAGSGFDVPYGEGGFNFEIPTGSDGAADDLGGAMDGGSNDAGSTPTDAGPAPDDTGSSPADNGSMDDAGGPQDAGDEDAGEPCTTPGTSETCDWPYPPEILLHGCARGMRTCGSNRRWGECQGRVEPQTETCNNMDDDCDGTIDNVYRECGLGICRRRMLACVLGREVPCTPFDPEPTERCNNLDDNCNGMVDEMLTRGCFSAPDSYRDRGACRAGTQTCAMGEWGACTGEVLPRAEVCSNTTDDDCDGTVNNGCPDM